MVGVRDAGAARREAPVLDLAHADPGLGVGGVHAVDDDLGSALIDEMME